MPHPFSPRAGIGIPTVNGNGLTATTPDPFPVQLNWRRLDGIGSEKSSHVRGDL
jgi:hypothetical protein